jgi:hypothetical protein
MGDNTRYVILQENGRPVVLVVAATGDLERDAFYLRQAITASGRDGAAYDAEGVAGRQLSSWDLARLDRYAAVALVSTRGLESSGRQLLSDYARGGGGVMLAAGPTVDAELAAGALGGVVSLVLSEASDRGRERSLAPADVRHPIFEAFGGSGATLGAAKFRRIAAVTGNDCQTLARFTTGETALLECTAGKGRVLTFASDLDNGWNDFPLHATFVPFVHETLKYLSGRRVRRGDYLIADVPQDVPARPGFMTLREGRVSATDLPMEVAVNVDPAESEPDRLTKEEFQAAVTQLKDAPWTGEQAAVGQEEEDRQHVWQWLLGLMVAMLAIESLVGARTS